MKKILLSAVLILLITHVWAQTPGSILKPIDGGGANVLDPDGDGYVSQKTDGVQIGFTIPPDNDVYQSEIPYVAIIRPDPLDDILRGPVGGFIEIVGVDAAGNNAILTYSDGSNLLVRFRLGGYAPNSKSYSLLIDTDGKFGFTGVNADPNAVTGNPGFEAEIVLETNFDVKAFDVNGTTTGSEVASYSYDTNCQKSMAISTAGGDPDYFYDFYLPFSSISSLFTSSSALRIVAVTVMNPHEATGNNALSDVGGVTTGGNLDDQFIDLIDDQTPTPPGQEVLDRTACPSIDPVTTNSAQITGSASDGTIIKVTVYLNDSTTEIGSGTVTASGSAWSIGVSSLSPSVLPLMQGYIIKASATASGMGESFDNCDIEKVTDCAGATGTSGVTLTKINGGKGYTLTNSFPAGTIFTWYNFDFTQAHYPVKSGSSTYITNPQTSTTANQTMTFSTETGQTFPNGVFYFTFQEPNKCVSAFHPDCQYSGVGSSIAPVITSSIITIDSTIVRGTCGSSANTVVSLFASDIFLKSVSVVSSTNWVITGVDLSQYQCASITARASDSGKCPTNSAAGVQVTRKALTPTITTAGCSVSPPSEISGFSSEANNSTVTLYDTNPTRTPIGTATVTDGVWTANSLTTNFGDIIVAAVTSGDCVTTGPDSNPITISTQTDIGNYSISINNPTEGDNSVTGTISGSPYSVQVNLLIDDTPIGNTSVSSNGAWSISVTPSDLYIGGKLKATVTYSPKCESDPTSVLATVQCKVPDVASYTGGSYTYCIGGAGSISLSSSESMVVYQLVNGSGTAVGPSSIGNGDPIVLTTYAITEDLTTIFVKSYKIGYSSCSATSSTAINFDTELPTPSVTFSTTSLYIVEGSTSVNLPFSEKSSSPSSDKYTINYSLAANNQGFTDITSQTAIPTAPGNISISVPGGAVPGTYSGTLRVNADDGGVVCTRSYGFTVTVLSLNSPPVITSQPSGKSICNGNSTVLAVSAVNATGYQWQSSSSVSGPFSNISGANSSNYVASPIVTTYYKVIVSNGTGAPESDEVSVNVISKPIPTGVITGNSPVCAGNKIRYSISAFSGATTYNWSYSGTNVTHYISSTIDSVYFAANATSGTLSVSGTNSCGTGSELTKDIVVESSPFINNMAFSGCVFNVVPENLTNGIVPAGTTYSWGIPVVTGGVTGGAAGTDQVTISGTLSNPTSSTQTATYTITPKSGSCTGNTFTLTISLSPGIVISSSITNLLCYGTSTGSINISATGGTPAYSYLWAGGATTQNRSNLTAAIYSVTVTDTKGCTSTSLPEVTQPSEILITPDTTTVKCFGEDNGAIAISVLGGKGNYTYAWNNGSTVKDRTGLTAGTYSVAVTDSNGCIKSSGDIDVDEPLLLEVSADITNVTCFGLINGEIDITAKGGNSSYNYDWSDIVGTDNGPDRTGLAAGNYSVTVTDAKGCSVTANYSVTQPALLSLSSVVTHPTCSTSASINNSNGAIAITVHGGTSTFIYDWNDLAPPPDEPEDRSGLETGTYSVTVTDSKGCVASSSFTLVNLNPDPVTPGTITK